MLSVRQLVSFRSAKERERDIEKESEKERARFYTPDPFRPEEYQKPIRTQRCSRAVRLLVELSPREEKGEMERERATYTRRADERPPFIAFPTARRCSDGLFVGTIAISARNRPIEMETGGGACRGGFNGPTARVSSSSSRKDDPRRQDHGWRRRQNTFHRLGKVRLLARSR